MKLNKEDIVECRQPEIDSVSARTVASNKSSFCNMDDVVLLSWNNQDIIIDLMLHSFQFRRQEVIFVTYMF